MPEDHLRKKMKEIITQWAEYERQINPSFSLVVGQQVLSIDQIEEHVEKETELGKKLEEMILETAAELFLPHQKPH